MVPTANDKENNFFSKEVARKEKQKLKALQEKNSVWSGLGMMGMIGWSVSVPSLLGAALGLWLDKRHPQSFSWTLSLLVVGIITGCIIAWYWVAKEEKEMHNTKEEKNE
ncbi:MAG: AtpZ/AtpI family protein [Ferruginibacter sp.]